MESEKPLEAEAVRFILANANKFEWSLQGFGMLRLYLSPSVRLHVWSSRYAVPGVSTIHTHPWDFESYIVAGRIRNVLFDRGHGDTYKYQLIRCGPGGCLVGSPQLEMLAAVDERIYEAGDVYEQEASEIHESQPEDGTVTIVRRTFKSDRDHALVFWPASEQWGSAEPRAASTAEIESITQQSLSRWFA